MKTTLSQKDCVTHFKFRTLYNNISVQFVNGFVIYMYQDYNNIVLNVKLVILKINFTYTLNILMQLN